MNKSHYMLSTLLVTLASTSALAASAPTNKGYAVGEGFFKPSLTVSGEYNDNIYTQESNEEGDYIARIRPGFVLETPNNSPHLLRFSAEAEQALYADESDNNYTNYGTALTGRYAFNGDRFVDGSVGYRKIHSSRGDNFSDPTAEATEPLPYHEIRAKSSFYSRFGTVTIRPRVELVNYDYENVNRFNGGFIDQDARDRSEYIVGGRLGKDINRELQAFVDIEHNYRQYGREGFLNRDSEGGSFLIGTRYNPDKILAEFAMGMMNQNWKNGGVYKDVKAIDAVARLDWEYSPTGKFRSSLRRVIDEVPDIGASAAVRTDVTASITQELFPFVLGTVGGRYSIYNYQGGNGATGGTRDRADDLYELRMGVAYQFTDTLSLTGDYSYLNNSSNLNTSEYNRNVVMVGLKYGFGE